MATQTESAQAIGTYTIDPSHSDVGFVVKHMGFSKVRGRFQTFSGEVRINPENLSTLEADIEIEAASIDTNEPTRDEHLRTNDFLDAQNHSTILFKSTGVRDVSAQNFKLEGELTIRGVTKPVVVDASYLGEGTDPWGGSRVGFEGTTKINRKDFGVSWNTVLETGGFLVGDQVEIQLDIQGVLADDE